MQISAFERKLISAFLAAMKREEAAGGSFFRYLIV
jgi:hypothetical protein